MTSESRRRPHPPRIVILAPNWLGDAVLALPAIADVRRALPDARLAVAARRAVAGLFGLVSGVDEVLTLRSGAPWWRRSALDDGAAALRNFDAALVLPNSFRSAWLVRRAAVPERWGYATDFRSRLLTRAVPRVRGGHQAEYYQRLTAALDFPPGPSVPAIDVPAAAREAARALLAGRGVPSGAPLVVLAPGAAYGTAKQWIPEHVAALAERLVRDRAATCAIVGSASDTPVAGRIRTRLGGGTADRVLDLIGATTLEQLAGVLAEAAVCVCNDSGAMHLAAAVGTPVVATFGPTNEHATAPRPRTGRPARVLTNEVWCRPCMLRECPIDHRCMRGLTPDRVFEAVARIGGAS
jgi:heptosyltransferase-2